MHVCAARFDMTFFVEKFLHVNKAYISSMDSSPSPCWDPVAADLVPVSNPCAEANGGEAGGPCDDLQCTHQRARPEEGAMTCAAPSLPDAAMAWRWPGSRRGGARQELRRPDLSRPRARLERQRPDLPRPSPSSSGPPATSPPRRSP